MERFSNNYQELLNQVQQEFKILELKDDETLLISYSELPWFPSQQFCILVVLSIENNYIKLIKYEWDNQYDLNRFSLGVYNLDRLCIKKAEIHLSTDQQSEFKTILGSITQFPDNLDNRDYIVLDGIDYELVFNTAVIQKKYHWKIANSNLENFKPLLNFLLAQKFSK